MVDATGVSPEGRIIHGDLGLWDDAHIPGLSRIAAFLKAKGAVAGIQIGHAGPKASLLRPWDGNSPVLDPPPIEGEDRWQTVSATTNPEPEGWPGPTSLDDDGIAKVKRDFVSAADRSMKAGFEVLELHCAHGFLLNAFLSPLSNTRTDAYGGSLENRMRLPLVRKVWPEDRPLFVRISAVDGSRQGWTIEEPVMFVRELARAGVDVIDNSSEGGRGSSTTPAATASKRPSPSACAKVRTSRPWP